MLQTKNLQKIFSKDSHISFSDIHLHRGDILCIDGPSGSGKTTFMKILAKLDPVFDGTYSNTLSSSEIAYFFHDYRLIESLSIIENIILGNINKVKYEPASIKQEIAEIEDIAKKLGVFGQLHIPIKKLSSGQYQRICLIRAFVGNKKMLILDEPTSHLDGATSEKVAELIVEYQKKGTIFCLSSHDISLFDFLEKELEKDKIIFMNF